MKRIHLLLFLSCLSLSSAAQEILHTEPLIAGGTQCNNVRTMVQDTHGYIWLGATDGLYRYDGYSLNKIKLMPSGELGIHDDHILRLLLWKERFIWVSARAGQHACYDTRQGRFVDYTGDGSYDEPYRTCLIARDSTLWLYDKDGGAKQITFDGQQFHNRKYADISMLPKERIDNAGNGRNRQVTDRQGRQWQCSYGNGLTCRDPRTGTTYTYRAGEINSPIKTNFLLELLLDRAGDLWVSQEYMGLQHISLKESNAHYAYMTTRSDVGHNNDFRLLTMDNGQLHAINILGRAAVMGKDGQLRPSGRDYGEPVVDMQRGPDGRRYTATRTSLQVDGITYRHDDNDPLSMGNGKPSQLFFDGKGRLWMPIFKGGLDMATTDKDGRLRFRHFFNVDQNARDVRCITADRQGYIWIGTNTGLCRFHPDHLLLGDTAYTSLRLSHTTTDEVKCLLLDSHNRLWIGTTGHGVGVIDINNYKDAADITIYSSSNGLPNDNIESLIEDRQGNIWIGTDYGLAIYDQKDNAFRNYFFSDGISLSDMYQDKSACLLPDGQLAFGTRHGLVIIDPQKVKPARPLFPLAFTTLYINGVSVQDMDEAPTQMPMEQLTGLSLAYSQNSLSFHFSDFNYSGGASHFTYILEGYDKDWSDMTLQNVAVYKNLPSGNYTLHVRVQNSNGVWNEKELTLPIKIRAPWWATWWAYLIYIMMAAIVAWNIYRQMVMRNRIRMEQRLTEYKMQFFTNISHEFRTPLTIIRGAMEQIMENQQAVGLIKQPITSMQKSVDRMMRLINQLMDFSKIHKGKLHLALQEMELVGFMRSIFLNFNEMAQNKSIEYLFSTQSKQLQIFADRSFLDKIAYNLLSNAFKYTPDGRSITLRVSNDEQYAIISVTDTGIGVSEEKRAQLFTRFDQSAISKDSIGIGLHLTHELVQIHHGSISYEPNPEGGSIFTVRLPLSKDVYQTDDFMSAPMSQIKLQQQHTPTVSYHEVAPEPINKRRVMIVEDDDDVQSFMQDFLRQYFIVSMAGNGAEALQQLAGGMPDLIITDVKMPVMDGYELTQKLRANPQTTDIPIIMLTALNTDEQQSKGIDAGADVYLSKPFSQRTLLSQCRQLLQQRDRMKTLYAKEVVGKVITPEVLTDSRDQRFQKQFEAWVEGHLNDKQLSVELIAESMGMGRTSLFKRVKKVFGQTPNDYIKAARMNKAQELLKDDSLSIAQVAYAIGIADPLYFSKAFKAYFGISPSKFRDGDSQPKAE